MGIAKDPDAVSDHEEDTEVSFCVEDELLSAEWGGARREPAPATAKQYLELQLGALGKRCPRDRPGAIVAIIGLAAIVALAVCGTTALRQSARPSSPAAERAQLQHELTDALGANFKAADYNTDRDHNMGKQPAMPWTDHTHPEQWRQPATFLQPHHLVPAARPQPHPSAATPEQVAAEQAQLHHSLHSALGASSPSAAAPYATDHNRPGLRQASPEPAAHRPGSQACDYTRTATCSARSLFNSKEMHRVVTDNLMRTSTRLLSQADYEMVNEFAWMGFQKINAELATRAPDVAQSLDAVHLRHEQKNAVLDVMALLSDPAVEGLGYNVAKVIRASAFATRRYLQLSLEESLEPIDEIREMASGLLPVSVVEAWKANGHDDWGLALDPENVRAIRTDTIKPNATGAGMDFKTKSLSVYAGVLQQGKVLLEIMRTYVAATGPSWSLGTNDAMAPLLNGITPPTVKAELDYMETFLWPLKCSSQGIDALRVSLCPKFGGTGHGRMRDVAADLSALGTSAHRGLGGRAEKGAQGLDALRAEFKR